MLRASELCSLTDDDLDLKSLTLRIKDGKRGKQSIIPISHLIAKSKLNPKGRKRGKIADGHEIEVYDQGRFFTMTGKQITGAPNAINNCRQEK